MRQIITNPRKRINWPQTNAALWSTCIIMHVWIEASCLTRFVATEVTNDKVHNEVKH